MLPKPYFKDVPGIGDLIVEQVLLELDYPLVFVCRDNQNKLYLCDCCDVYEEQRWLISPATLKQIISLLKNQITVREILFNAGEMGCTAVWSKFDPENMHYWAGAFRAEDLPDEDSFLDAEDGEFNDYIESLNKAVFAKWYANYSKDVSSFSLDAEHYERKFFSV